ncbi:unnamed protein product [Lymnaea stagnalis]|uniref:Neurotransmitter-gated ion-channel ligand-binding domain-containing protein n=1 Tax=Lymnaea stagnalis TaxID=6523 RepID=A0AAV2HZW4_LYMST
MTLVAYFRLSWLHKELTWNLSDYDGHSFLILDTESVWTPEFAVAIGDKDSFYIQFPKTLKLDSSGLLSFSHHQYISFRCEMDLIKYPFDTQVCHFGLYPVAEPILNLELKYFSFNITGIYHSTKEWYLVNSTQKMVRRGELENYVSFTFTVRRRLTYYVILIIFPMVLTSLLIPLVFFIPARSGEKMSYIVAILTSSAIFIGLIR